jgi:cell division protein FtsB
LSYTGGLSKRFLRILEPEHMQRSTGGRGRNIAVIVAAFIPIFIYTWLYIQTMNMNYEANKLRQENEKLKSESKQIEMKLQAVISNEKIAAIAKARYGFKNPDEKQIFVIRKHKSLLRKIMDKIIESMSGEKTHEYGI